MPLTWKESRKVAPKIRASWQQNKSEKLGMVFFTWKNKFKFFFEGIRTNL